MLLSRSLLRPLCATLLGLATLVGGARSADAAVMKCTGPGGRLTYTDGTCPRSTEKRQLLRTTPEGGDGQLLKGTTAVTGSMGAGGGGSGPAIGGGNGASPPAPTIVGGPRANAGAGAGAGAAPSVSGANSDVGQTAVGTGATAPTDITAPVATTP